MNCKRAQEHISLHLDARLDPAGQASLNRHLERCAECSSYLRDLEAGLGVLRDLSLEEPSANFEWNLKRKLQQAQREPWRYREESGQRRFWPRFTVAAAAALVLTLGGAFGAYRALQAPRPERLLPGTPVAGDEGWESLAIPTLPQPYPGARGGGEDAQIVREGAAFRGASVRNTIQQTDPGTSLPPLGIRGGEAVQADSLPVPGTTDTDGGDTTDQR